jgi:hypothetical protein
MRLQLLPLAAFVAVASLATPDVALAQANAKVDVTGKWLFTVTTDGGSGTPTVTLKQTGDSLSGHYSSQVFGEVDLTGNVKGKELTFSFTSSVQGTSLKVTYSGTIESNDALKGTVDLGGLGSGTFTAKRQ